MKTVLKICFTLLLITTLLVPLACTRSNDLPSSTNPGSGRLPVTTHLKASSLEEASQITGFTVLAPGTLPDKFNRSGEIDIIKTDDNGKITFKVMQRWVWEEDTSVYLDLTQDPELDGIINGTSDQIGKWPGQRRLYPPDDKAVGRLELYWKTTDSAFVLFGFLTGPLDEATMYTIAASIVAD